LSKVDKRK